MTAPDPPTRHERDGDPAYFLTGFLAGMLVHAFVSLLVVARFPTTGASKMSSTKRPPDSAIYAGHRNRDGSPTVTRTDALGALPRPLPHVGRHSPDGFQWGYGGSGPADLALSILTDALGPAVATACYQQFKWDHVAQWRDSWRISILDIRAWAHANLRPQAPA